VIAVKLIAFINRVNLLKNTFGAGLTHKPKPKKISRNTGTFTP